MTFTFLKVIFGAAKVTWSFSNLWGFRLPGITGRPGSPGVLRQGSGRVALQVKAKGWELAGPPGGCRRCPGCCAPDRFAPAADLFSFTWTLPKGEGVLMKKLDEKFYRVWFEYLVRTDSFRKILAGC